MTLESYTHRLVVMAPEATAYDAIRAMEDNHIGAVVVQENGLAGQLRREVASAFRRITGG
jgi:CBS domain-containing protein